jgi:small-conductance mechanosensitive channel
MANSFVFKENIHNYSAEFPFLWDEITVPIRLNSDYKSARKIFIRVLDEVCGDYAKQSQLKWKKMSNKFRVEEAQVLPMVSLVFSENWITFTLRYVVDYKKRRGTKDIIFSRILDEIHEHKNIQIASTAMEITDVTKRK